MPRQVRIEFPGAMYHVMCRGDRRENIFLDDGDREMMHAPPERGQEKILDKHSFSREWHDNNMAEEVLENSG